MILRLLLLVLHFIQYCKSQNFICCDGAIRLSGSSLSNEGRVEMCVSSQWKTICDNNWSENEARVVCRQLGHGTQVAAPLMRAAFGMGTGMIVEQVRCNSTERRLADCTIRDAPDGECNHNEDAGVRCSCRNGDLRLQGSIIFSTARGRVEVCSNNVWGTICDDSWDSADAKVVCNQLGFSKFGVHSYCCARYGRGSGPVHMTNVGCIGNESSLTDCPHTTNNICSHSEDAAVRCRTTINCHDGDVRLVNGSQPHEGRVEICFNETWGTICHRIYLGQGGWNHSQADIVCKQLGYMQAASSTTYFGRGSAPAKIAYVYCRGTESNLAECSYITSQSSLSSCVRYNDIIGVQCRSDTVMNGTLRLADGLTQYEGRVEMYWDSDWKSICNDEWDELDAMVVCRQLKYLPTSVQIYALSYDDHHFKSQRSPMLLGSVGCRGSENNITSCCSIAISNDFHCLSQTYAGVRCSQCIENSVQLVGELSQQVGSPVICLGGRWGKVCDTLNTAAAVVVCRQLGFSIEDPIIYYRFLDKFKAHAAYGPGLLPFTIQNVQCTSNETQFSQCNYGLRAISQECREWSIIGCQTARENIPGTPQALKISRSTSSTLTLTWSPPPLVSEIHGLIINRYVINCSSGPKMQNNIIKYTDFHSATFSNLDPFTSYNCCVAAVSDHGSGKLACINAVTAPSGAPIRLQSTSINSTTLLLSWHAPNAEYVNGILRGYSIQVIDNSTGVQMNYTTDSTHIFLNNLWPTHPYTFRVAAYTNGRGPFSQLTNITLNPHSPIVMEEDTKISNVQHRDHSPLTLTASFLGLVSFTLLIVVAVVSVYISYKLCKQHNKKVTRPVAQVPVYEMVDMPPELDLGSKPDDYPCKSGDVHVEQLILTQEQAKDFSRLPHEYLTPAITKFDQSTGPGSKDQAVADEENTYQPLIPPRLTALSTDKSQYQSLTKKTLPAKFSTPSAPPAIPPKPKATSTITQGCVQHVRKEYSVTATY